MSAKSTTEDRVNQQLLEEALWALELWTIAAYQGKKMDAAEGERLVRELVEARARSERNVE